MNMQNIMAQAQKMQREITQKKEEIDKTEYSGKSEWVETILMGDKTVKSIKIINKSMAIDDIEMLEDMIKISIDDAMVKINEDIENKLGMYGKMNGLF